MAEQGRNSALSLEVRRAKKPFPESQNRGPVPPFVSGFEDNGTQKQTLPDRALVRAEELPEGAPERPQKSYTSPPKPDRTADLPERQALSCREHDATPDLVPLLDLAHSIFNAATGVPASEEASEVRAFRPLAAWRALARAAGFVDLMVRAHDPQDPTDDVMLCFMKPFETRRRINGVNALPGHVAPPERFSLVASAAAEVRPKDGAYSHCDPWVADALGEYGQLDGAINERLLAYERRLIRGSHAFNFFRLPEWMLVHVPKSFAASLDHTAWFRFPFMRHVALYWRVCAAESAAAARAHGVARGVLANRGFHMAVVIGAVLTFVFGQVIGARIVYAFLDFRLSFAC